MTRTEFIIATAIVLFVAFCTGWFANWLIHRFTRVARSDVEELEKMAQELLDQPILKRMECHHDQPAAGCQQTLCCGEAAREFAQFVIHIHANGLKSQSRRMGFLATAPTNRAWHSTSSW